MSIDNNTLLLLLVLGLVILFVSMNCSFSCGSSEGFMNQINDPYAVDFANLPAVENAANTAYDHIRKHTPVSQATEEHTYAGHSDYTSRPKCHQGYYSQPCNCGNQ